MSLCCSLSNDHTSRSAAANTSTRWFSLTSCRSRLGYFFTLSLRRLGCSGFGLRASREYEKILYRDYLGMMFPCSLRRTSKYYLRKEMFLQIIRPNYKEFLNHVIRHASQHCGLRIVLWTYGPLDHIHASNHCNVRVYCKPAVAGY